MKEYKKLKKKILLAFLLTFLLLNVILLFHAYNFTHFSANNEPRTKSPNSLSFSQKLKTLALGVNNPRPKNVAKPKQPYQTVNLQSNIKIEGWLLKKPESKGTVILFHGYGGNKSSLIDKAVFFGDLGYSTLLMDFGGAGGSEGNQTTIGFKEAEQVKTCYEYLINEGENHIILFGTSMGAVAIMRAVSNYKLKPSALIIECPFGSMLQTVNKRCENMHLPAFPFANLLVFWGGTLNGFNAFAHKPTEYAKKIAVPTLLLHGGKDKSVTEQEIKDIFANLKGHKKLSIYPKAGHENYWNSYKTAWQQDVKQFLQ
jgi:alpha-beta hydrolase superfamily lysophospholipase